MRVYVIRHGESESNASKKWTGWTDVHLTKKGVNDAKKAAALLENVSFDKIYSSDLKRSYETMRTVFPDKDCETTPLLREQNVGTLANQPLSLLTCEDKKRISIQGFTEFSGESKTEFFERIKKFMNILENSEYETVAVFSHGGFLRGMLNIVMGTEIPSEKLCCNNCTVSEYICSDNNWKLKNWINV